VSLCGTCKWWDHKLAARHEKDFPGFLDHRISICRWGQDLVLPEWCSGLRGDRWTNEAGTTERGCKAWEPLPPRDAGRAEEQGDADPA
jgi:hypothetical protein